MNEDTKYLDDLDEAGQWISLAREFVAHDYGDDVTLSYYKHLEENLCHYRNNYMYPDRKSGQIRQAFDQVRKKAFWDILRNRSKVLPALYGFLAEAYYYFLNTNDIGGVCFEPCVERNELCVHSTECCTVTSVILLHVRDRDVPKYWEALGFREATTKLILRSWISGDLRNPDEFFERYIEEDNLFSQAEIMEAILEEIPDEFPEIKVKAMRIVAAFDEQYGIYIEELMSHLTALHAAQTQLSWRMAEIILRYVGAKPLDYLERLTDAFNDFDEAKGPVDLTKPAISMVSTLCTRLEDCIRDYRWFWEDSSAAEKHGVVGCFVHVVTKAWLDLVLQDHTGNLALNAGDILKIREDFGGLPQLRVSVDAAALVRTSTPRDLQNLRPKVLENENIPEMETRKDYEQ